MVLSLGLATGLAAALPLGSIGAASATPAAAGHHVGGAPGWGRGHSRGPRHMTVGGTAQGVTPAGFDVTLARPWAMPTATSTTTATPTVTSTATTVDVQVAANTHYIEPGQSSPGISGVLNGDTVRVTGVQAGTDAITALVVTVPMATDPGTVTSLGSTGFSLTTAGGNAVTVNISSSTKFRERAVSSPTVQTGDTVQVTGTQAGTGTVNATLVIIGTPGRGHHHGHGHGGP